jgi:hypothetical protein
MRTRLPNGTIMGDGGACFAVEDEPVVFHAHGVRDGACRQHGVLLQMDEEVVIDCRLVGCSGMHDEAAEHADHLLHRHVRVVEEGAALVDVELVDEAAAG